ncbi:hypothetical protein D3C76_1770710 [compost metagenome]
MRTLRGSLFRPGPAIAITVRHRRVRPFRKREEAVFEPVRLGYGAGYFRFGRQVDLQASPDIVRIR